jgi:hypothetical protein
VLERVAWVQQRNHQVYRSHRARRQEDGEHASEGCFLLYK